MVAQTQKPRLQTQLREEIGPKLMQEFGLKNPHQVPTLSKIVVNVAVGRHLENQKLKPDFRDTVISTLSVISGQKPIMVKARQSVANFKVREGAPSAFMVTMPESAKSPVEHRTSSTSTRSRHVDSSRSLKR